MKNILIHCILVGILISNCFSSSDFKKDEKRVINTNLNIMWQDDIEVTQYLEDLTMATLYCESLILNGFTDWKLPNITQLISIIDVKNKQPSIQKEFKFTSKFKYISTTQYIMDSEKIWFVDFKNGSLSYGLKSDKYNVRCLRDLK